MNLNLKGLVPWNRDRTVPVTKGSYSDEASPFFALHREMNRLFDDFFRDFDRAWTVSSARWPSVEVRDGDKEYRVIAELPGLEERDVDVTYADGVLEIKGEKHAEEGDSLYTERWSGSFMRRIPLGDDVDADRVKATFKNGVLTVTLAKKPEAQRNVKRITVN